MNAGKCLAVVPVFCRTMLLAFILIMTASVLASGQTGAAEAGTGKGFGQWGQDSGKPAFVCEPSVLDSPYIPVDSWVYPATLRLYSLGFIDSVYLGMRPWTRSSLDHALEEAGARIEDADQEPATDEAEGIYEALIHELHSDMQGPCLTHEGHTRVESIYSMARVIGGTPLRDSYHLGSTVINDYGRPYASGFNSYSGASGYASAGRFLLYLRGEFQGAPSASGYSASLAQELSNIDLPPPALPGFYTYPISPNGQATIPLGPIATAANGRVMEAYVRPTTSTTKYPSASRMNGWGLDWAAAWPIPTTPKTSMRSTSTASNRCAFRCSPGLQDPSATSFLWALSKGTATPTTPGCIWRRSASSPRRMWNSDLSAP